MKRFLSILLCSILTLSLFSGCLSGGVEQTNESLSIYYTIITDDEKQYDFDYYIKSAINRFSWDHPDITVTIYDPTNGDTTMSEEQAAQIFSNDIMAGKGPDFFISSPSLSTIKMMKSGAFCDLLPLINSDEKFEKENYKQVILDAGKLNGQQLIMPISCSIPYLITMQSTLDASKVDFSKCGNSQDYLQEAQRLMGETGEMRIDSAIVQDRVDWASWAADLVDYETMELHLDTPDFQAFQDLQKAIYEYDQQSSRFHYLETRRDSIVRREDLFYMLRGNVLWLEGAVDEYMAYSDNIAPPSLVMRNSENQLVGSVKKFAAIRMSSPNQKLAYDFMKVLAEHYNDVDHYNDIPLTYSAGKENLIIIEKFRNELGGRKVDLYDASGKAVIDSRVTSKYTPEIKACMEEALSLADDLDKVVLTTDVLERASEFFEPYYTGESSYEDCLAKAQEQLTIYLSE